YTLSLHDALPICVGDDEDRGELIALRALSAGNDYRRARLEIFHLDRGHPLQHLVDVNSAARHPTSSTSWRTAGTSKSGARWGSTRGHTAATGSAHHPHKVGHLFELRIVCERYGL